LAKNSKSILVTIAVELPYDDKLLNYNSKLNNAVLEVIGDGEFACSVTAGSNLTSEHPINKGESYDAI